MWDRRHKSDDEYSPGGSNRRAAGLTQMLLTGLMFLNEDSDHSGTAEGGAGEHADLYSPSPVSDCRDHVCF